MIKNIFIPERVGSYYIFGQRMVGLVISKYDVQAVQLWAKDRAIKIEKIISQPINGAEGYQEKVAAALASLAPSVRRPDQLCLVLSGSHAVCKVLKLPFTSYDKIKMVVPYEVEPLLPFPADQARIDFIITSVNQAEQSAQVFVMAVQNHVVQEHRELLANAGLEPHRMTLDMVALYTVLQEYAVAVLMPDTKHVIVDIGSSETRMAYVVNKQLIFIRSLPKGIVDYTRAIAKQVDMQPQEVYDRLMLFGVERTGETSFDAAVNAVMEGAIQELSFAINAFAQQSGDYRDSGIALLLVEGHGIASLHTYLSRVTSRPCTQLSFEDIVKAANITYQKQEVKVQPDSVMALSAAMSGLLDRSSNLLSAREDAHNAPLFFKQCMTFIVLVGVLVFGLAGFTLWQRYALHSHVQNSATEIITALQESFPTVKGLQELEGDAESQVADAIALVKKFVATNESKIRAYSGRMRSSLVRYLSELSTIINKNEIRLTPIKIGLTGDKMTFSGSVGTFDEVASLRNVIGQSPLFGKVTPASAFNQTRFNATIELKKPRGSL